MIYQIKDNKSTRHPSQHIVVDASYTVTPDLHDAKIKHRSFSVVRARCFRITKGLASRCSEFSGSDLRTFWNWLYSRCNRKLGTWIWCDDLDSHLVYLDILSELHSGRLQYKRSVLGQRVGFLNCDTGQGCVTILERQNWWRCPVSVFTNGESMLDALSKRVVGLCKWVVDNDMGCLRVTAAGQSLAAYRHRLGPKRTWNHTITKGKRKGQTVVESRVWPRRHGDQEVTDLERAAYYGGPTHCYYLGKVDSPVYVLDVRSLYPYVMRRYTYPCELIEVQNEPSVEEFVERTGMEGAIAYVQARTDKNVYPVRRKNDTYYCRGTIGTALANPEILRACQCEQSIRLFATAWYRMADLFSKSVDYLYGARFQAEQRNDALVAELYKLILNSLPAKFGQQSGEWRDDKEAVSEQAWGYWYHAGLGNGTGKLCRSIANSVQSRHKQTEAPHSFPAIPAFVCSYARVYMDELIAVARSGGKVYYSAVDSIHCDAGGWTALAMNGRIGNDLGQLRHKGTYRSAEYKGIGNYVLDGQVTRSGLPAGAVYVGGDCWQYRQTECASELIGHGPSRSIVDRQLKIELSNQYRHGRVGQDGWVTPFDASEV